MRIRTERGIAVTDLADGGLAIVSGNGTVYHANTTAANMWAALDSADGRVENAIAAVTARYGVCEQRIRTDLDALLTNLHRAGIVAIEP